ncbi:protein INCA1-like [Trichomycterus rosablanca]|uniref:protein INCA1-like n=1 Tax=Trichomycterus rosablanca TaxID=2290929 RepID=UPI002F35295B
MWHQWSTNGFQLHQTEPAEPEQSDQFLSFAKRSREVHRQYETGVCVPSRILHHSPLTQYNDAFWEKIVQHPSEESPGIEPSFSSPVNTFPREPPELVCDYTVVRGTKRSNLCLENLPTPSQLMSRKRKGGRRLKGDAAERQVTAVTQHIGELRRKQSIIDQMKKEKWWGSTFSFSPETSCYPVAEELTDTEDLNPPGTPLSPRYAAPSPAHLNIGTLVPKAFGDFRSLLDLAPGGNPMMSFVVTGTADRGVQRDWDLDRLSHTEFWGFRSINEE